MVRQHSGGVAFALGVWGCTGDLIIMISRPAVTPGSTRPDVVTSLGGDGMAYQDGFRRGFTGLDPVAAPGAPITFLLAVSAEPPGALGTLGIVTVFDLATALGFKGGTEIAEIATVGGTSAMARPGIVPGSLPDPGRVIAPEVLAASPVADLNRRTMPGLRP
jgi:hypothetical protein